MMLPLVMAALVTGISAAGPIAANPLPERSAECPAPAWPTTDFPSPLPSVAMWTQAEFPHTRALQSCLGWGFQQFTTFVAVVGTFETAQMEAVLERIGAISTHKEMRYWSVTDQRLESLIKDAYAVKDSTPGYQRSDFTPAEMQVHRELLFAEQDNRSSYPVLYRMTFIERSPDRIVVDITNANRVRRFLLTLFEPGDLRTALFISRTTDGTWTCYLLSAFHPTALAGMLDARKSQLNRVIALYGHIAGLDDNGLPWAK